MKKYLMTGIAAVAMCAAFTSCSHDIVSASPEDIEMQRAEKIQNTYNKAFIATFGQPAADQDWGFSSALTRAITPTEYNYTLTNQTANNPTAPAQPSFRGNPGAPTFSATVPQGTPEAKFETNLSHDATYQIKTGNLNNPQNWQNVTYYVVDNLTWNAQINSNGNQGTTFIITEGKTLTFNQTIANNARIYMAPGSHLVIGDNVTFKKNGAMLYVGNGCTVTCGANVNFWEEYTVLNECGETGSFTANQLNIEQGALFYNNSPLTANTGIKLHDTANNKGGELVNNSQLTTPNINVDAGAKMYNTEEGTVDVSGKTYLYNTNSAWMNDGIYNSGDFELNSIDQVWNNCKLTVHKADNTGEFKIAGNSHTSFVLNGSNSVQTDKMYFGNNADFYMNGYSILDVLGECKAYNANKNHGIHGLGSNYSIFKAGSVTYNTKVQNCMNYYGNVYVDTENHFAQELLDKSNLNEASDQPTYYFNTTNRTVKFKFAPFNDPCPITATIASGKCCHGYTVTPPPTDFTANLRVMAEDLSASEQTDFDFNDIVFDIQYGSPAQIRVMAAGGTLPLRIKVKSAASHDDDACTGKDGNGWQEIHALWGKGTGIMINTNATTIISPNKGYETSTLLDPIELDYAVNNPADAKNIIIEVKKTIDGETGWYPMNAETGEPAAKFACSPDLRWANEREDLKGNSNFSSWVQGAIRTWNWNNFQ